MYYIREADMADVPAICAIMEQGQISTAGKGMFFMDDEDFIRDHIKDKGFTLVAMSQEPAKEPEMAAFLIVRIPKKTKDNLGHYLSFDDEKLLKTAHMESCVVDVRHRGNGLEGRLVEYVIPMIYERGYEHILCTVHPDNKASLKSVMRNGVKPMFVVMKSSTYKGVTSTYPRFICYKSKNGAENREYFQLVDENGDRINRIKERRAVHRDGDLHGASHIWIMEKNGDSIRVLLQKRSNDKDSFPGALDCSCAGHMDAGEDYMSTALRELGEELGIESDEEELTFLFKHEVDYTHEFYGEKFKDHEVAFVYLYDRPVDIGRLHFQESEIQGLMWQDCYEVKEALMRGDETYCIIPDEFFKVLSYAEKMQKNR